MRCDAHLACVDADRCILEPHSVPAHLLACEQAVMAMQAFRSCGQEPTLDLGVGGSDEYRRLRRLAERAFETAVAALRAVGRVT